MYSTLIVARMHPPCQDEVAAVFGAFDESGMPYRMGTLRRQLFHYKGLYFHLQDFAEDDGSESVERARRDPRFVKISDDLKPFIQAYEPETWRSPADAMATRFYHWEASA